MDEVKLISFSHLSEHIMLFLKSYTGYTLSADPVGSTADPRGTDGA